MSERLNNDNIIENMKSKKMKILKILPYNSNIFYNIKLSINSSIIKVS